MHLYNAKIIYNSRLVKSIATVQYIVSVSYLERYVNIMEIKECYQACVGNG